MTRRGARVPGVLLAVDFRRLLVAETVSALGDWMGTVAFIALVFDITHSPTAVGGMLTLRLAPAVVAGPLAARAVSRWNPRRTMLAMNAVRAAVVAVIPLVPRLWWVFFWAFLLEMCGLVFLPARDGSIIHLLPDEEDLPLANGLVLGSSYATLPLGAGMFSAVSALSGGPLAFVPRGPFALAFWLDAATFVLGFVLVARITALRRVRVHPPAAGAGHGGAAFLAAVRMPLVRAALPPVIGVALSLGSLFSVGIDFVKKTLHASDGQFGVLIILFGVGAAIGLGGLQIRRPRQPLRMVRPGVTALGVVLAAMSLAPNVPIAFAGAVGFGAAAGLTLVAAMTGVQTTLADDTERQLAFAAFHVGLRLSLVVGALAAGVVGDLVARVSVWGVGRLDPARVVLCASGLVVLLGAWAIRGRIDELTRSAPGGPPLQQSGLVG